MKFLSAAIMMIFISMYILNLGGESGENMRSFFDFNTWFFLYLHAYIYIYIGIYIWREANDQTNIALDMYKNHHPSLNYIKRRKKENKKKHLLDFHSLHIVQITNRKTAIIRLCSTFTMREK